MVGAGADREAVLPEGEDGPAAVCHRDDAAGSLPPAVVRAERPGDGRGAARHARVSRVRQAMRRGAVAGRDDDPEVPPPAGEARPGDRHAASGQRHPAGQGPVDEEVQGGRRHADRSAEFDEERVDAESGLVHSVVGWSANVNDVTQAGSLLHGVEEVAFGDAGYRGVHKRGEAQGLQWHVAMRAGDRRKLNPFLQPDFLAEQAEKLTASIRAQVEHPFRVLKRQFGYTKVRYRGLAKNTVQIVTLFALSNLWMARRSLMGRAGMSASAALCGAASKGTETIM